MSSVREYIDEHNLKHKCKYCDQPISLVDRPSVACYASSKKIPLFCNKSCHGKYLAQCFFTPGEKHVAYKNGSSQGYNWRHTQRSTALLKNECNHCGITVNLVTHYKDGNPRNNPRDGSNWERLCRSCLSKELWKGRKLSPEERLKRKEWYRRKHTVQIPDGFITTPELIKHIKLSRERIRQLRNNGRIRYATVGKRTYIYNIQHLIEDKWLDSHSGEARDPGGQPR